MSIQKKIFERILNMAQIHNIGVLHRGPNMLWTCRWNEDRVESSIGYQLIKNPYDQSLKLRLHYRILPGGPAGKENRLDYTIAVRTSLSYKRKTWFWFVCPLIINGKPCQRRVRNLYLLPSSEYFGCKHCRDLVIRSLPSQETSVFRQTRFDPSDVLTRPTEGFLPDLRLGWRPAAAREICTKCGCLSEGLYCCNCGARIDGTQETSFFEILGIGSGASPDEVLVAFKTRLKEYHPDRVAHLGKKLQRLAEDELKQINLAYETLSDPDRRSAYLREFASKSQQ